MTNDAFVPELPMEIYTRIMAMVPVSVSLALLNKKTSELYVKSIYVNYKMKDMAISDKTFYLYSSWVYHIEFTIDFPFAMHRRQLKEFTHLKSATLNCLRTRTAVLSKKLNILYNAAPNLSKIILHYATTKELILLKRFKHLTSIELPGWRCWSLVQYNPKLIDVGSLVSSIDVEFDSNELFKALLLNFPNIKQITMYSHLDATPLALPVDIPCIVEELETTTKALSGYPPNLKKLDLTIFSPYKFDSPVYPLQSCTLTFDYLPSTEDLLTIIPYIRSCKKYDICITFLHFQILSLSNCDFTLKPVYKGSPERRHNPLRMAKVGLEWISVPMHEDNVEYMYYDNEEYFETTDFSADNSEPTKWYDKCCIAFGSKVHDKIMELFETANTKYF